MAADTYRYILERMSKRSRPMFSIGTSHRFGTGPTRMHSVRRSRTTRPWILERNGIETSAPHCCSPLRKHRRFDIWVQSWYDMDSSSHNIHPHTVMYSWKKRRKRRNVWLVGWNWFFFLDLYWLRFFLVYIGLYWFILVEVSFGLEKFWYLFKKEVQFLRLRSFNGINGFNEYRKDSMNIYRSWVNIHVEMKKTQKLHPRRIDRVMEIMRVCRLSAYLGYLIA